MLKRIAIIELYYHHEVVQKLAELLLYQRVDLILFTIPSVTALLPKALLQNFTVVEKDPSQKKLISFFNQHQDQLQACDGIIITTIASDFKFWANYQWPLRTLLIVHNFNSFFDSSAHLRIKNVSLLRSPGLFLKTYLKLFLFQEKKWRKQILEKIDYYCPFGEVMLPERKAHASKWIAPLPLLYHKGDLQQTTISLPLKIVIPGNISKKGKDFAFVVQALALLETSLPETNIQITFLGKAIGKEGKEIIQQLKALELEKIKLHFFEDWLPANAFKAILKESHLLWLPIQSAAYFSIYQEKMGYTKASATLADGFQHGKLALIPDFYPLPPHLEAAFIRYNSSAGNQGVIINTITNKTWLENRYQKALPLFKSFSIENRSQDLTAILNRLFT